MIRIESAGRLGNKLLYFIFARYIHDITGMSLIPEVIDGFKNTFNYYNGETKNSNILRTSSLDLKSPDLYDIFRKHRGGIIVDTMLHKYQKLKDINIKEYLSIDNEDKYFKPGKEDLVIHIRLGDYKNLGFVTDLNLYLKVVKEEKYDKCYIVTDSPNDKVLDIFRNENCMIHSTDTLSDFVFIKNANKICISKSTYSWLAAYISDAEKIYFPMSDNKYPYYMNPVGDDADYRPYDKNNWIII